MPLICADCGGDADKVKSGRMVMMIVARWAAT
jgi:hypothetical protein